MASASEALRLFQLMKERDDGLCKVFGREEELRKIQQAFDRVAKKKAPSSEVVVIEGPSGSGKSSLVRAFMRWTKKHRSDLKVNYGRGKYEQLVNNDPFAAIVAASNKLCEQISNKKENLKLRFLANLRSSVGSEEEISLLTNTIPGLSSLACGDSFDDQHFMEISRAFTRFKQLWQYFLFSSTSTCDLTVLFLDDLQWADLNSLDLINTLLSHGSTRQHRILLLCAYRDMRSISLSQADRLKWCFSLGGSSSKMKRTELFLNNLDLDGIHKLVVGCLYGTNSSIDGGVHNLSSVVHDQTKGNPFFALRYLDFLTKQGLLYSTNDGENWDWNLYDIVAMESMLPRSLSHLLKMVVGSLSKETQRILTIAAFIGHRFSPSVLESGTMVENQLNKRANRVVPSLSQRQRQARRRASLNALQRDRIREALDTGVREGLLEKKNLTYVFPHDQIQQCLCNLVSKPREKELLHLEIGTSFIRILEQQQRRSFTGREIEEADLFVAVDNLNQGADLLHNVVDRVKLVWLNFEASQLALRKSSFEAAVRYTRSAISLLDDDRWKSQYDLSLDLYSLAAKLEHCTGNFVRSNLLIAEIHRNATTIIDRLPAFYTQIDVLGSQGDTQAAQQMGIMVLQELGEPIPSQPGKLYFLNEVLKVNKEVKRVTMDGFSKLPEIQDPVKLAAMSVLSSVCLYSFLLGREGQRVFGAAILRMVRISCAYGLCKDTPFAFVSYAAMKAMLEEFDEACSMRALGHTLLERIESAELVAGRTFIGSYGFLAPWCGCSPREISVECIRGYQLAVAHGDVSIAYYGAFYFLSMSLFRGVPLLTLHSDYEKMLKEMEDFQINTAKYLATPGFILARQLLGKADNVQNDLIDVSSLLEELNTQSTNILLRLNYGLFDVLGKVIFGTLNTADEAVVQYIGDNHKTNGSTQFVSIYSWTIFGVASLDLWRKTRKRKYRRNCRQAFQRMSTWHEKGIVMATAPFHFFAAELMSTSSDIFSLDPLATETVEEAYLTAAKSAAGPSECLFLEALSHERLADVALSTDDQGAAYAARDHLNKAARLYKRWGAVAKLDQLSVSHRLKSCHLDKAQRCAPRKKLGYHRVFCSLE